MESGATLETGGERFGTKGHYIQPTVFSNVEVFRILSSRNILTSPKNPRIVPPCAMGGNVQDKYI